jgi:hypothetical protein
MKKLEKFLNKVKILFGDQINLQQVEYINSTTKIKLTCRKHNYTYMQVPAELLRGKRGCKFCNPASKLTTEEFIRRAKETHGDLYDYTPTHYNGIDTSLIINCKLHGPFNQRAGNHLNGSGCSECSKHFNSDTKEQFIAKATAIHKNKYDYTDSEYISSQNKIKILCKKHGVFTQYPYSHLRGKGCRKCATEKIKKLFTFTIEEFIEKAKSTHGDKYDYSLTEYISSHDNLKIICPIHGQFEQTAYTHMAGHGCEKCTSSISSMEGEINTFLKGFNIETITSSRSIIAPNQLDIYIPSKKIAIEFNGLYWHSEQFLHENYHLNKTDFCEGIGIKLIQIFEDEWLNKKDIVKSRLKNILNLTTNIIYGRKCQIKEISNQESREFLNKNHIQGMVNSMINIGLIYDNELVALMTFGKMRKMMGYKSGNEVYELVRFCNKLDTTVIGGANKLLKFFIRKYNPKNIISYADRRWSQGDLYEKLGFQFVSDTKPNYWYVHGKNRKHRYSFKKDILIKDGFDKNKSEKQIMFERKIFRIYDCGSKKYEMKF